MTTPHVFVTLGDVTHVECDAWMLPSDSQYNVEHYWTAGVSGLGEQLSKTTSADFSAGSVLAIPVAEWDQMKPLPILTAVPLHGIRDRNGLDELAEAVGAFIEVGAREAKTRAARHRRPKALLAMPALGTGQGGGKGIRGEVLKVLLDSARAAAMRNDVDVVLVLKDPRIFALAQQQRTHDEWTNLSPDLVVKAQELAVFARDGKLVPFMGAGVSISAGGPTWETLIRHLAEGVEMSTEETKSLTRPNRSALDQAAYLRERYTEKARSIGDDSASTFFGKAIAAAVSSERYGLAPALLASLRTEQAITLNYDDLFERAAADFDDARTVIPGAVGATRSTKWLLKLHGSISEPASIVLTRDDYLGFNATREALSAIVKANLITHHLLFVGFGLADDHFHQIIHDVRQSLPNDSNGPGYATAITLIADPLDSTLWKGQLDLLPMESPPLSDPPLTETARVIKAGRQLEIFLDALVVFATDSHSYLLDDDFATALSPAETSLRSKLLVLQTGATDEERNTAGWRAVSRMFDDLGS
jgi:hypothetical protein